MMLESEFCDKLKIRIKEKSKLLNEFIKISEAKDKKLHQQDIKARSLQTDINTLKEKYKKINKSKPFQVTVGFSVNLKGEVFPSINVGYKLVSF